MNPLDIETWRHRAVPVALVVALHVVAWLALIQPHFSTVALPQTPIEVRMLKPASPPPAPAPVAPSPPTLTTLVPEVQVDVPAIIVATPEPPRAMPASDTVISAATEKTTAKPSEALLNVDESELRYLQIPEVRRPTASRRAGEHGIVHLWLYIDEQGRVMEVRVNRSSSFKRLDEAALKAMTQARFVPYTKNGKAYPVTAIVPVEFPA